MISNEQSKFPRTQPKDLLYHLALPLVFSLPRNPPYSVSPAGPCSLAVEDQLRRLGYVCQTLSARMAATDGNAKKTVAVVGSGLAGLTTAYLLHSDQRQRYTVTLLECVRILSRLPQLWAYLT